MKFIIYWRHGRLNTIEGDSIEQAFTNAGYGAGAVAAIDFYDSGEEIKYNWNKAEKDWDRKTPIIDVNAFSKTEPEGKTCLQFMQWVFRDLYLNVFKSFDPIPKGEAAKDLSNGEIRRMFNDKCIQINGDFFAFAEELPPLVYSLVLFPNNERLRRTLI
jgi:hypothetical protein